MIKSLNIALIILLVCSPGYGQPREQHKTSDSLKQKSPEQQSNNLYSEGVPQIMIPAIYSEESLHKYGNEENTDRFIFGRQHKNFIMPDSLKERTYRQLEADFFRKYFGTPEAETYAMAYLYKAKSENDTVRIANAYNMLMYLYYADDGKTNLSYADSIIAYTKSIQHYQFPMVAYLFKGETYHNQKKFKSALDNFLLADKYTGNVNIPRLRFSITYRIASMRDRLLDYRASLQLFKDSWKFVNEEDYRTYGKGEYFTVLHSLATAYRRLQATDSASVYNRLGVNNALSAKDSSFYYRFVLNEGINQYTKGNNTIALDSILKAKPYMEKIGDLNLGFLYTYLGKLYHHFKQEEDAVIYLKKADTVFRQTADMHPELRSGYELLIRHYETENDPENQLRYIKRLMEIDSVINEDHDYILRRIIKDYDTPKLLSEKENIIAALNRDKIGSSRIIIVLATLTVVLFMLFYYQYQRQKTYKKRFEALVNKTALPKVKQNGYNEGIVNNKGTGIAEKHINDILAQLSAFEKAQDYLNADINIHNLAKSLQTNSKYLSRVVNHHKKKNFSNYINDLRIDYVVELLKTNPMVRRYNIKAIAQDSGFNNAESFSRVFYRKTGIYPSYFIKQLELLDT